MGIDKDLAAGLGKTVGPPGLFANSVTKPRTKKGFMIIWLLVKTTARNFFRHNGLFLAMGLGFNLLLYFIPLTLLMISLLGYTVFESQRAMNEVMSVVRQFLPHSEQELADNLAAIVAHRGLLGLIGFVFFFALSSTLFGSVRHVLNLIFKAERRRGFFQGIARDFVTMSMAAILLILTIGVAALLALARSVGGERLPFVAPLLEPVWLSAAKLLTLVFLASLFYVLYRFAPAQTLRPRALLIAALSGTMLFEIARWGFAWYVTLAHESIALYGALAGLMFFFFWLYYASAVFVLGAEIGLAYEQARGRIIEK
jgi:membrane protein